MVVRTDLRVGNGFAHAKPHLDGLATIERCPEGGLIV